MNTKAWLAALGISAVLAVSGFFVSFFVFHNTPQDFLGVTVLPVQQGGTGLSSVATGDLLIATTTNLLAALNIGSTNQLIQVSGGKPAWTSNVTSTGFFTSLLGWTNATGGNVSATAAYVQNNLLVGNMVKIAGSTGLQLTPTGHNFQIDFSPGFLQLGTTSADKISFFTSNNFRMNIDASGNLVPETNNAYELGSSSIAWKTIYGVSVSSTNATTTNFSGTYTTATNLGITNITTNLIPGVNNLLDLGSPALSLKGLYTSGTANLGNGVSSTGGIYPTTEAVYDIGGGTGGSGSLRWNNAYIAGTFSGSAVSTTNATTTGFSWISAVGSRVTSTGLFSTLAGWTSAVGTNTTSTGLFGTLVGWTNASGTNVSSTSLFTSLLAFGNASGSTGVQTNVSSTSFASSFASFAKATATLLMVGDSNPSGGIGILSDNNNLWDIGAQGAAFRNAYVSGTFVGVNVTSTEVTSTNISATNALFVSYGTGASNIVTSNKTCTYINMNVATNSSTLINSLIGPTSNIQVTTFSGTSTAQINTTSTGVVRIRPLASGAVVNAGSTYEVNICVYPGIQ